ncbi:MAG: transporter associated domain-containing protein [Chloroflexota bacterium]|nr:transporter associated domain-containing protein [Chloroflexota bacterium]
MTEQFVYIISIIILLVLDIASVGARTAYLETSYPHLLSMREADQARFNRTLPVIYKLPRVRASMNLMLVVLRFLLAGLVLALLYTSISMNIWVFIGVLLIAGWVLFLLEWLIDRIILPSPEAWAMRFVLFVRIVMGVMLIPLALPMYISGDSKSESEWTLTVTEDEFMTMVDAGQEEGFVEETERRMIHSIFRLGDTLTREIMVPRIDINALDVSTSLHEAVDDFVVSGHSRVPVYEETVDNTLGILYAKDLLRVWGAGEEIDSLRELLRPANFVPEAKKVDELLEEMQSQRIHIAIVVDEYGGIAGLVTMEDIVEEIFGEIQDEYDDEEELPYQELKEGGYIFLGGVDLDDFNGIMGSDLPSDEADTLGGYIYAHLGRVPTSGEQVRKDGLLLTVDQVSARRIRKVRAVWNSEDIESEKEKENAHR